MSAFNRSLALAHLILLGVLPTGCAAPAAVTEEPRTFVEERRVEVLPAETDSVSYDVEPVPLTAPPPAYPAPARDAQIEGRVLLHVLVGTDGLVRSVKVIQGVDELNESAMDAAKKWTFQPALKNGVPVATWIEIPMSFHF
jgi:bla regulator protein blaR1